MNTVEAKETYERTDLRLEIEAKPLLYTDAVNDQQICRDDQWQVSTAALNKVADELARLRAIEAAALRVASSRRDGAVVDKGALDLLDAALEARP